MNKTTSKYKAYRILLDRVEGTKFERYAILIDSSHYKDIWHEADKILDDWRKTVPKDEINHTVEFKIFFDGQNIYNGKIEIYNYITPNLVNHILAHCDHQINILKNAEYKKFFDTCNVGE